MPQSGYQIVAAIMAGINARAGGRSRSTLQRLRQKKRLAQLRGVLRRLAEDTVRDWPGSSVVCEVSETYRNMREVLDRHPKVLEHARTERESGVVNDAGPLMYIVSNGRLACPRR